MDTGDGTPVRGFRFPGCGWWYERLPGPGPGGGLGRAGQVDRVGALDCRALGCMTEATRVGQAIGHQG